MNLRTDMEYKNKVTLAKKQVVFELLLLSKTVAWKKARKGAIINFGFVAIHRFSTCLELLQLLGQRYNNIVTSRAMKLV